MKISDFIYGFILATVWWCLVWPTIKRGIKDFFANIGMWFAITYVRLYHLIKNYERLSTYHKREYQKYIDDTYEQMGWPRGTFTEWQLSDGKGGIAKFNGELHGFTSITTMHNDIYNDLPPERLQCYVVVDHSCMPGFYTKERGWNAGGQFNSLVTRWRIV